MNRNSFRNMATLHVLAKKTLAVEKSETDLSTMTKPKLVEFGKSIGIQIDNKSKKGDILEAIISDPKFLEYESKRKLEDPLL